MSETYISTPCGEFYGVTDSDILNILENYIGYNGKQGMVNAEQEMTYNKLVTSFDVFYKDIKRILYKYFKVKKKINDYNDEELGRMIILGNNKDLDNYYRSCLIAIIKVMDSIKIEFNQYKNSDITIETFGDEAAFLHQLLFQICEFTEIVSSQKSSKNYYRHQSRKKRLAGEVYRLARDIPRGRIYLNDIVHFSESIFLIRQAIEVKTLELLYIQCIWDNKSQCEYKVAPDAFLNIIDEICDHFIDINGNNISVNISYITAVHHWTNMFIHSGRTYWAWEVEFLRRSIESYIFSSLIIKKDCLSSLSDIIIKVIDKKKQSDVEIVLNNHYKQMIVNNTKESNI
ncbi:MAG: hypothetical protein IK093_01545 [Ruminiclostridium sp.]|nr:hypothetical protein [Ruminiclostridium sp.]